MNWTDQAETMVKAWTEAQKKIWTNWYDLAQAAPASSPFDTTSVIDYWHKLATQGLEAWLAGAEPTARDVARRLFASQETFLRFLKFAGDSWKTIAARVEAGEDWPSILSDYTEEIRQQLIDLPARMFKAAQDSSELWRLYQEELQKVAQPWVTSFQQASGHLGQATTGNGSALIELANLYWDTYERTFGRLLESPSLGYTRELDEKILKGFHAWQEFRQVSFEYQVILAETWIQVFQQLMHELFSLAEKGETIQELSQLIALWNEVVDPVFIEAFRSERYIRVQGRLLNAGMTYRLRQREIVELFLRISDIPTRSELDEAHRTIYEQGKEIKALKKSTAGLSELRRSELASHQELAEARRAIEALQAEVAALQKAVTEVSASKPTTRAARSATGRKQKVAPATAAETDNSGKEGGEGATVSDTNPS